VSGRSDAAEEEEEEEEEEEIRSVPKTTSVPVEVRISLCEILIDD